MKRTTQSNVLQGQNTVIRYSSMTTLKKLLFTQEEYARMQAEVHRLEQELVEVLERLKTAREMGDLSENGAYRYAKVEVGNIRRQLSQLHFLLSKGVIVKKPINPSVVEFGCKVTLFDGKKESTYTLVGPYESNPALGKLSLESPLGISLVGKKKGETATITTPTGKLISYTIRQVE